MSERDHGCVEVILSTYNGAKYLNDQLESIKRQTYRNTSLRVRDDGSVDGTLDVLRRFEEENEWVVATEGRNLGVVASFLKLLGSTDDSAEYVAFCDQDDIWDKDKIERAVDNLLHIPSDIPGMYCSSTRLIDESGQVIGRGPILTQDPGFGNAMVQNIATGCTIVINKSALRLLIVPQIDARHIAMHDWWVYLTISAFGKVLYDPMPSMSYRQHSENVIGSKVGIERWVNRVKTFTTRDRRCLTGQVEELLRVYSDHLPVDNLQMAREFVDLAGSDSILRRLEYSIRSPIYRQQRMDDLLLRMLLTLGWR